MRFALALALLATSALPAAVGQECVRDPLVTLGGPSHPAPGAYATLGCSASPGAPVVRIEIDHGLPAPSCVLVPGVFVLGSQVPGTGAPVCAVPPGGFAFESPWNAPIPDRGVAVCGPAACASAGAGDANALCAAFAPVDLQLGAFRVRVSCLVTDA